MQPDAEQAGYLLLGQHLLLPEQIEGCPILEYDIHRQLEGPGVFGAYHLGDIQNLCFHLITLPDSVCDDLEFKDVLIIQFHQVVDRKFKGFTHPHIRGREGKGEVSGGCDASFIPIM